MAIWTGKDTLLMACRQRSHGYGFQPRSKTSQQWPIHCSLRAQWLWYQFLKITLLPSLTNTYCILNFRADMSQVDRSIHLAGLEVWHVEASRMYKQINKYWNAKSFLLWNSDGTQPGGHSCDNNFTCWYVYNPLYVDEKPRIPVHWRAQLTAKILLFLQRFQGSL